MWWFYGGFKFSGFMGNLGVVEWFWIILKRFLVCFKS